jgi:hypothetical protein
MKLLVSLFGSVFALLALWSKGALPAPDDLVRHGNAAFERGDFATATDSYAQAEDRTHDPGLVAFNEATVLYQLGQYREAELRYRRSREDAVGTRLARLLFNLGNCLLQQDQGRGPARLREAIKLYQQCLEHPDADANLVEDARHNLELARLLYLKAKAGKEGSEEANAEENPEDPRSNGNKDERDGLMPESANPDPRGRPGSSADAAGDAKAAAARADQSPPPGKGNLPPVPDQDDLVSLSPEDAAAYLKQAAVRILRDREEYRRRPIPAPAPNVLDW